MGVKRCPKSQDLLFRKGQRNWHGSEKARLEARRLQSKERKAKAKPRGADKDSDIVGIRPGPQPLPEQWGDAIDDE